MAQIRFNIGVPRAGSAAREAESAPDRFRSLRPQAGSAARQAEDERRRAAEDGAPRPSGVTTLRMRGVSQQEDRPSNVRSSFPAVPQEFDSAMADSGPTVSTPLGTTRSTEQAAVAGSTPGTQRRVESTPTSLPSSPLQTAAAKFTSLFRSVFPRATGEN